MVFEGMSEEKRRRIDPLKIVFALGYVLQGIANPFQGLTYQPFTAHLSTYYGLGEGATQSLFAKSYLAWSFKPIIGFLIDAYGRTRTLLIGLLALAALGFLVTPLLDTGPMVFFGLMFGLSVVLAGSDVAIDRATVIAGDEEAKATGRSRRHDRRPQPGDLLAGDLRQQHAGGGARAGTRPSTCRSRVCSSRWRACRCWCCCSCCGCRSDTAVPTPVARSIARFWAGLNSGRFSASCCSSS